MPVSLSAICPTCNALISDDDRTCPRCGVGVSAAFPAVERTPLILPGNPALSADLFRRRVSPVPVAGVALVGVVLLCGVLYARATDDLEPSTPPLARGMEQVSENSGTEAAAPQRPSIDSIVVKPVAPTTNAAALPPIPSATEAAAVVAATTPALRPIPTTAAPVTSAPVSSAPVSPAPVTPAAVAIKPAPTPVLARAAVATAAVAPAVTVAPVLRLASLVSDSLRPGELVQLRWTLQDRTTGRAVPAAIEFTSTDASIAQVDRRTGIVSAIKPGRVTIIADAGTAGESRVALFVRASTPAATVAAASTEPLQMRGDAARSVSTLAAAPTVRAPVVSSPPTTVTREVPRGDLLDADDVRGAVDRFVSQVRSGSVNNFELLQFLGDGAGHRAALLGAPATIGAGGNIVRVTFDVRLTKFDAGGRPVTRIAPISMDIEKRLNGVTASAVAISPLRKP